MMRSNEWISHPDIGRIFTSNIELESLEQDREIQAGC
jgi:hypothetical protein